MLEGDRTVNDQKEWLRKLGQHVIDVIARQDLVTYRAADDGSPIFVWDVAADLEIGKAVIGAVLRHPVEGVEEGPTEKIENGVDTPKNGE